MGFSYNVNVLNQKGSPAIYTDTFANRPAPGYAGRLFVSSDTSAIYEDTGTAWTLIANVSSGAGTLQQVTTNGNTSNVGISITAGGVSTNSLTDTSLTTGSVPFAGAGGLISQDNANLFWDDTNNRLGINTNTPGNSLDVHSAGTNPILALNNTAGNQSAVSFLNTSVAKWRIGNAATNTLDIYNFTLAAIALQIKANNEAVFISSVQADDFVVQPTGYSILAALSRNLTGAGYGVLSLRNSAVGTIQPSTLSVDRTYTLPDATGTIALTSNLSAYLPLAGGTLTGGLGGTSATFSGNVAMNSGLAAISAIPSTAQAILRFDGNDSRSSYFGKENSSGNYSWSSGGTPFATVICAYNQTTPIQLGHNSPEISLFSTGNLAINSTIDNTVDKLQVTGSANITSKLTVSTYGNILAGTFDVPASTTKTVTVSFTSGNIHAFMGFSSESGGVTGAGAKSIFLGGTASDGAGHTPTVISTFSYGDQVVGLLTTNTTSGFTFTIQNNKASVVSYRWSAFGSFNTISVT